MAERLTVLAIILALVALVVVVQGLLAGGIDDFLTTYGDHT